MGADLEAPTGSGATPLHTAARYGSVDVLQILLEKGAIIDKMDNENDTPLSIACSRGHQDYVAMLIENGANALTKSKAGRTIVQQALEQESINFIIVLELLQSGRDRRINELSSLGWAPLHYAAVEGDITLITMFLTHGANIHLPNEDGDSALWLALSSEKPRAAAKLLSRGASQHGLLGYRFLQLSFQRAVASNHLGTCKVLLKYCSITLDAGDESKWTPLHHASNSGFFGIVQILLQHGASIDKVNNEGFSALHLALRNENTETATILIDEVADINSVSNEVITPLHLAFERGFLKVLQTLMKLKPYINKVDNDGVSAQLCAATETRRLLINSGADVNRVAKFSGHSPLYTAARVKAISILSRYCF